jgi:cysteine synthase
MEFSRYIGNTPVIEIPLQGKGVISRSTIFAKLEWFNPGGCIKDRIALYMLKKGFESGQLSRDKTVLEATNGNMGLSLAMLCAREGLKLKLIMPDDSPQPILQIIRSFGAEIMFTPAEKGLDESLKTAYDIVDRDPARYFFTNQFNNGANPQAHYETTGKEILEQTSADITHLVAGMGTTGTIMGVARRLKKRYPHIQIVGVEPVKHHHLQGLRHFYDTILPGVYDPSKIHRMIPVTDQQAQAGLKILYREHGLPAGPSSGAAFHAAMQVAEESPQGATIVTIFPDGGDRYTGTDFFSQIFK